jgi:S1-C subfamily serine protease
MRRRDFIVPLLAGLFSAGAAWPLAAQAQGPEICGWIGVRVHPMTVDFAESLGMVEPYGAIFGRPRPGSPAAKAHIEAYDVVTKINGSPLRSWRGFAPIIAAFASDTTIHLTTWRSRLLIDVRVVLGRASCNPRRSNPA